MVSRQPTIMRQVSAGRVRMGTSGVGGGCAFLEDQIALPERWTGLTDKAFFMGDSSLSVPSKEAAVPHGPYCRKEDRTERFTRMFNDLFARPCCVGWNWCGWMDSWIDLQNSKQHGGLQIPFGEFHEPTVKTIAVSECSISAPVARRAEFHEPTVKRSLNSPSCQESRDSGIRRWTDPRSLAGGRVRTTDRNHRVRFRCPGTRPGKDDQSGRVYAMPIRRSDAADTSER